MDRGTSTGRMLSCSSALRLIWVEQQHAALPLVAIAAAILHRFRQGVVNDLWVRRLRTGRWKSLACPISPYHISSMLLESSTLAHIDLEIKKSLGKSGTHV